MKTLRSIPRQDLSFFITLGVIPSSFSYLPQFQNDIISILQLVDSIQRKPPPSLPPQSITKQKNISSYCFNPSPELIDSHEMRNQSHSIPAICWNLFLNLNYEKNLIQF